MTVLELKEIIIKIPNKYNGFQVVNGRMTQTEEQTLVMVNDYVHTLYVDEKAQELQFLHQTDEDIKELVKTVL